MEFDEKQFTGSGTALMKKLLQQGKYDKVPNDIIELQYNLPAWLSQLTPAQLSSLPEYAMETYFLSSGLPDPTKAKFRCPDSP